MATHLLVVCLQVVAAAVAAAASLLPQGASAAGDECGRVKCGMGTCSSESGDYAFGFACRCNPGWSRHHLGDVQFPFLPCVIPNCTVTSSCQDDDGPSPPPAAPSPSPPPLTNLTIFDPCLMQYCGDGGACEKAASGFAHRCRCRDGYANLLNDTSYPCYRRCSLGADCEGLGINVINGSTPTTSSSSPPAPVSFTVKKSAAAPADARLLPLLALLFFFLWVQLAIW